MSNFGKFVVGAVVGGAVGAALGMLLAPRSGAETREMIRDEFENRTRQAADSLQEKTDLVREKASALKDKMSEMGTEFEEAGRRTISKFTDKKSETPS